MTPHNFLSLADILAEDEISIVELIDKLETDGLYQLDDFNRVTSITTSFNTTDIDKITASVRGKLAQAYKGGNLNQDYISTLCKKDAEFHQYGWSFDTFFTFPNKNTDFAAQCENPANQSHFYRILIAALFKLMSEDDIRAIAKVGAPTNATGTLGNLLGIEKIHVSNKTLRNQIRTALIIYDDQMKKLTK